MEVPLQILTLLFTVILSLGMETDTPEDFLETLSSSNADVWIEHQAEKNEDLTISSDTIVSVVSSFNSLSVNPGNSILEDINGGYRLIYPESHWTWRLDGGRIGSIKDTTIIEWKPGGYMWVVVPFFTQEGASLGRGQSLCMGATLTAFIIVLGVVVLWYIKRRYSS